MKIINFLTTLFALYKVKVLKQRIPLMVSFALTSSCNQRCIYCEIWKDQDRQVKKNKVFEIINNLRKAGTCWISFTGGEILLRGDLKEILEYTREKGINISLSSNGRLVPDKIDFLRYSDRIKLSIDGPKEINDKIRGAGSFKSVIKAIELCKSRKINTHLECVLSKYNLEIKYIKYLIDLAKEYMLKVSFQPATRNLLQSQKPNPVAADQKKYREIINYLKREKKKRAPIFNSLAGLNHLCSWPKDKRVSCSAGLMFLNIKSDGKILACDRNPQHGGIAYKDIDWINLKKMLKDMKLEKQCNHCWCASLVEMNLIFSFNLGAILNCPIL